MGRSFGVVHRHGVRFIRNRGSIVALVQNRKFATARITNPFLSQSSLHQVLCDNHNPNDVAVIGQSDIHSPKVTITYGELESRSRRLATALLENGVKPGDRVGVMMAKSLDVYVSCVAIARVGAIYLPLFTAFGPGATKVRVESSGAKVIITEKEHRGKFNGCTLDRVFTLNSNPNIAEMGPGDIDLSDAQRFFPELSAQDHFTDNSADDIIAMVFTSGTTGNPKGVPLPYRCLVSFETYLRDGLGVRKENIHKGAQYWNVADPGWAYGLYYNVYGTLATGTPSYFLSSPFNPDHALQFMRMHKITHLAAAPTFYRAIKAFVGNDSTFVNGIDLKHASSAGEPLTPAVTNWFSDLFGVRILDHYGQSESGMMCINHQAGERKRDKVPQSSMGIPLEGINLALLNNENIPIDVPGEVGDLAVDVQRSPVFWFSNYWDSEQNGRTKDNRYYVTGDKGYFEYVDSERRYFYQGRGDDVISSAGYRVGPSEVENSIMEIDFVAEVGVIGVPDDLKGEAIKAVVVLKDKSNVDADDATRIIKSHVKSNLAKHLVPKYVEFMEALPKTESGKIKRFQLRSTLSAPVSMLVQAEIRPDLVDEFLKVIETDAIESRKESGCLRFDVLQDVEKENKFVFYESYTDAEAVAFHKTTPHYNLWAQFKGKGGVISQNVIKCKETFLPRIRR